MKVIRHSVPDLARLAAWANIDRLVEDLASHNDATQIKAARYLGELRGARAAKALQERLLVECFEPVQVELCKALGEMGAVEALADLEELAARTEDEAVKQAAGVAVGLLRAGSGPVADAVSAVTVAELRTAAVEEELLAALSDESGQIRALAADALGRLVTAQAVPALLGRLKDDPEADVRVAAAEALRTICVSAAVAAGVRAEIVRGLADALHDQAMWVQAEAAWGISRVGGCDDEALRTYMVESFFRAVPELLAGKPRPWWGTFPLMMKVAGSEGDMVRLVRMLLDATDTPNLSPLAGCLWEMAGPGRCAANPFMMEATREGIIPWKMLWALALTGDEAAIPLIAECAGPRMDITIRPYGPRSVEYVRNLVRTFAPKSLGQYPDGAALLEAAAREWLGAPEIEPDAVKAIIDELAKKGAGEELRTSLAARLV